jgi:membrane-bound lytic murein transglycosylase B
MKILLLLLALVAPLSAAAFAQEDSIQNPAGPNPAGHSFEQWLTEFRRDAAGKGISQATLDDAFAEPHVLERVIELDRKQPEARLTLDEYLDNVVNKRRIKDGRRFYAENRPLLNRIGRQYDVQPRFIVALWGIETNYGRNTGGFHTIDALATLAFDGRRSAFFREELIHALTILQKERMAAGDMKGSWAGALGQCQFMPGSFLKYAVDYNKDGRRDIWDSKPDVFASIANYLKTEGWNGSEGWGRPVRLPKDFDKALADIKSDKTLSEWNRLGVRRPDGKLLPDRDLRASLIMVGEGEDAGPYIVYGNYKVILHWNRSRFFATAVGHLADAIGR